MSSLRINILAFDGMEALDFAGPFEVFTTAARMLVLIPGGVVDAAMRSGPTLEWIAKESAAAGITASVCTGAFLLAASGAITRETVTTHWEDVDALRTQFPQLTVESGVRWVDRGRIVTSAGISAGIDMSLHLVARLGGMALAERTARQMDFAWTRN